ncbi:MAG TPA: DUF6491 family protein [Rhizomicrobium sp.]|nr:DUF6491 family protein [Rhizomicrobium sp.]
MAFRFCLFLWSALTFPALAQNNPPLTGSPCLQTGNIAEYRALPGDRTLLVIDKSRRQYRVDFTAACAALQVHPDLGFNRFNPSQFACLARGDSVYSSRDVGANRLCRIQSIEYFNGEPPADPAPAPPADPQGRRQRG